MHVQNNNIYRDNERSNERKKYMRYRDIIADSCHNCHKCALYCEILQARLRLSKV